MDKDIEAVLNAVRYATGMIEEAEGSEAALMRYVERAESLATAVEHLKKHIETSTSAPPELMPVSWHLAKRALAAFRG